MHWRDARQLCGPARSGRGRLASSGRAWLADGRSDGRAYGKGRAASLPGQERNCGGYARAAGCATEIPRRVGRTVARQELKSAVPRTGGTLDKYIRMYILEFWG